MGTLTPEVVELVRDLRDALAEHHPISAPEKYAGMGCRLCKLLARAQTFLDEVPT